MNKEYVERQISRARMTGKWADPLWRIASSCNLIDERDYPSESPEVSAIALQYLKAMGYRDLPA